MSAAALPLFAGLMSTHSISTDGERLSAQLVRVRALMADHRWRTLAEIADAVAGSEAGVSARLRELRKLKFGGFTVERRRVSLGLYEYRVLP